MKNTTNNLKKTKDTKHIKPKIKKNLWDHYYRSRYQPIQKEWGVEDLKKYKNWYYSWFLYIRKYVKIEKIVSKTNGEVFEIGSGIGATVSILKDQGFKVIGSDISPYIVRQAGKVNPEIEFVYCDIRKEIPGKKKYDLILGFEVLEHLKEPETSIKNIYNSLKKDGYFMGTTPFPFPKNYDDPTHVSVKHPEEWKRIFKNLGYSTVKTYPLSVAPFIWRINKKLNLVFPFYIPFPLFISTTLIIARKGKK